MENAHVETREGSQAGRDFELRDEVRTYICIQFSYSTHTCLMICYEILQGAWWAALPRSEWPEGQEQTDFILQDFQGEFGDRRQELVFIGIDIDVQAITAALDACLLNDDEMTKYKEMAAKHLPPDADDTLKVT